MLLYIHILKISLQISTLFQDILCTNISSTSTRAMSCRLFPALLRAALIAGTGPIPMIDGSTPATEYEAILARGVKLCSFRAFSLTKMSAAAPSQIP